MPSTKDDRVTLGVTADEQTFLQDLQDDDLIASDIHGFLFAVAYALKMGLKIKEPTSRPSTETKYNRGSIPRELAEMVELLRPDCKGQPYRYIELLAEAGISELKTHYYSEGSGNKGRVKNALFHWADLF